jgi:hypothetical protein
MNTGPIVAIVVVLVVAALAWLFLRGRKDGDAARATSARPPVDMASEPATRRLPVEPAGAAKALPSAKAAPGIVKPPPAATQAAPATAKPPPVPTPATPAESITVIMARPRPPVPVFERVLVLEKVDEAEWRAARPLVLSVVQGAAVASALTAATPPRPGESTVHAVRFDAGSAIRIARGDLDTIRAVAARCAATAQGKTRWLDSAAATALAANALAALARERWLDALGDEMRDLKASLAALPPKLVRQGEGRLKALIQDLSRFAREARDNYVSVIGKFAFRERVGEGCVRAAAVWHELVVSTDALRQQLDGLARRSRFGEVQVQRSLAAWRELQEQERLQEIAARALAGMHTLRLALGDTVASPGVDSLASAAAALQAGIAQDRELAARLAERAQGAEGDPEAGTAEFAANRAALGQLLDGATGEAMVLALGRLQAAASTEPLDAGAGAPSRLLVHRAMGEGAASLRWSAAPRSG